MRKIMAVLVIIILGALVFSVGASAVNEEKSHSLKRVDYVIRKPDLRPESAVESAKRDRTQCYLLSGQKWSLPVNYTINPANAQGIPESQFVSAVSSAANAWDNATPRSLFSGYSVDYSAQFAQLDGKNFVGFYSMPGSGIIGGTTAWYDTDLRYFVEFDTFLNTDYFWGDATQNASVMDIQNVVTHELGHALGLGDVSDFRCSAATMFSSTAIGETGKRTLESADITGIRKIYR